MTKHASEIPRNYLDSRWFERLNKITFGLLVISQLMQAMAFEGLINISSVLCFLLLQTIYQFRKEFGVFYASVTFFVGYFM